MGEQRLAVSTQEAVSILGVSKATVARLVRDGELEAYKLTPGITSPYRIYRDSIDAFVQRRQHPTR